jgi:hypothetical protein
MSGVVMFPRLEFVPPRAALCHDWQMKTSRIGSFSFLSLIVLAAVGCAASEEEVKREFNEFVSEHQACEQDSECTLIQPGCPLGCSVPVASNAAQAGERLARELRDDYERGGRGCDYDCVAVCGVACESNTCTVVKPASSTDFTCP